MVISRTESRCRDLVASSRQTAVVRASWSPTSPMERPPSGQRRPPRRAAGSRGRPVQRGRRLRSTPGRRAAAHPHGGGVRGHDAPQRHQPRGRLRAGPAGDAGAGTRRGRPARRHREHGQRARITPRARALPDPCLRHVQGRHRLPDADQRRLLRRARHPRQHGRAGPDHLAHVRACGGGRGHAGLLAAQAAHRRWLHRAEDVADAALYLSRATHGRSPADDHRRRRLVVIDAT